jgi:hypothetical protein
MWSSIVYQPLSLAKAMLGARVWRRAVPLRPDERIAPEVAATEPATTGPRLIDLE